MKLEIRLKLNDVSIRNLLATVLSLQIALWAVMGLSALGVSMPIVQPLLGFIYLTFVPGILVLTALRLRNLDIVETVLYAVGLSVAVVLSIGLVANFVFNAFNIIKPFSFLAVTSSVSFVVLALCAIAYFRNRTRDDVYYAPGSGKRWTNAKPLFNTKMSVPLAPTLFLCIIPFIPVFSTYLVNTYNVDAGQLALYLLLGIIVLLIAFDKVIPSKLYPLAVFVIALSLLFQQTLISAWLTGWDIQIEWGLANSVLTMSVWNPNLSVIYDAMLSVVALAPIYSLISSLNLVWVFKLVYPILFALAPVGLYQIFRRQLNEKVAFLSCFFFVSIVTFYTEMTGLARQEVAELFVVLLILLLVSKEMNKMMQSALFMVFGLSLVASHYGLTYIFLGFLIVMWLVFAVGARVGRSKLMLQHLRARMGTHKDVQLIAPSPASPPRNPVPIVSISVLLVLFIASTTWYLYAAQASIIQSVVLLGSHISGSIGEMFNPTYSQAVNFAQTHSTPTDISHKVSTYVSYLNVLLITAGVCLVIFLKKQRFKLQESYVVLSAIALGFLVASVALPFLGAALNWTREYQIASIFLAPFLAIGFIKICQTAGVIMSNVKSKLGFGSSALVSLPRLTRLLAVYLVLFMLLQTGFIFALTGGYQTITLNNQVDYTQFNPQEIIGATWLVNNSSGHATYADAYRVVLLQALSPRQELSYPQDTSAGGFYIFLGTFNIQHNKVLAGNKAGVNTEDYYTNATPLISNSSLIYSNGGTNVYL